MGGFYCPRILDAETTNGYDIVDIRTNERTNFLMKSIDNTFTRIGRYSILLKGLEAGCNALNVPENRTNQIIKVDEVGNLELKKQGWASKIDDICE